MNETAIIILAAGNSSRLGKPKQLLSFYGKPLLVHVVDEAIKAGVAKVLVVTGFAADEMKDLLAGKNVTIIENVKWNSGMAEGIVLAINAIISNFPQVENVIISVCDQPFINAALFNEMILKKQTTQKNIIACSYSGTKGVPVLFSKIYFNELLELKGAEGAKKILVKYESDVDSFPFEKGSIDIDTAADYERLQE